MINTESQADFDMVWRTVHRDLAEPVDKGLSSMVGSVGQGTHYVLNQCATNWPNRPETTLSSIKNEQAIKGPKGPK